jgi:hypothetical protein
VLAVSCWQCHHQTIMSADPWPNGVPVPSFGQRMVCTRCGIIGADARPNWQEQPQRESLTGATASVNGEAHRQQPRPITLFGFLPPSATVAQNISQKDDPGAFDAFERPL